VAGEHGVYLMLEPLNRYEQHLLRRQQDAVEIIERCQHPHVRLISDFFHMHIEEPNTPAAIRQVGDTSPTYILPITPGSSPAPATSTFAPDLRLWPT